MCLWKIPFTRWFKSSASFLPLEFPLFVTACGTDSIEANLAVKVSITDAVKLKEALRTFEVILSWLLISKLPKCVEECNEATSLPVYCRKPRKALELTEDITVLSKSRI